jgi:hypothetical protein
MPSFGGADVAVAAAAADTAIPDCKHTANTSRLDATASGSGTRIGGSFFSDRCRGNTVPARARTTEGPGPTSSASANKTAAALTARPPPAG